MDQLHDAIAECKKALALDPEFGNPWNDIGAYLIELGDPQQAIPYHERGPGTRRDNSHEFAYVNLGRAYVLLGRFDEAIEAFKWALDIDPTYQPARDALISLIARFN